MADDKWHSSLNADASAFAVRNKCMNWASGGQCDPPGIWKFVISYCLSDKMELKFLWVLVEAENVSVGG
jgi:hypothetical protein